jgi:hypothetical protein
MSYLGGAAFKFKAVQVCVFCHTPHGANDEVRAKTSIDAGSNPYLNTTADTNNEPLLLWNRALANVDSGSGGSGYSVYTSSTLDADVFEVRVYSLLCMSCHDGVGALNVMTNPPTSTQTPLREEYDSNGYPVPRIGTNDQIGDLDYGGGGPNIGERDPDTPGDAANLSNDHPISFDYDSALVLKDKGSLAQPGLRTPNGDGTVGPDNLRLFINPSGYIKSMECSSCHDPHNYGTTDDLTIPFLAVTIRESRLCTNCHLK